ncbi:MAG: CHAT domain-containing protein [bacterium]|nr:CHAT domain-containing protein [bacterium]
MDGNDYYANHCDCGAAFEDYSLFEEMGSPFMPMSAEDASRVRVYPVVERFEFQGSCQPTLGTAGDWLSVYGEFSAWDSISDCVSPDVVMAHDLLQRDNLTLRVRELAEMRDRASSRFEIALEAAGSSMRMLGTHEHFDLWPEPEITSSLRWYFEESPSDDQTPEAEHGARLDRVGRGMAEMGSRLFGHLFRSTRVACDAWCCVRDRLHDIRVEIVVTTLRSRAMPWELLLSDRGEHLALACKSFVVGTSEIPETREWAVPSADEPLRVLLVTCRLKVDDIPRDVMANALVDAVSTGAASTVRIEHLRPPTFRKLREVLLRAALRGAPFHVVHFDGHGTFVEDETPEAGRGAVIFEHAQMPFQYVDGRELAAVLKDARVPWLVMNACQSARLDAPQLGTPLRSVDADPGLDHPAKSLGREALEEGLIGVVAMRYKVEVKTACVFYGAFYEALASGAPVGVAANHGRRRLEMGWHKEGRLKLEGLIPVVYEAMPFSLFRDRHEWMQLVDELRATPRDDDGVRSPAP